MKLLSIFLAVLVFALSCIPCSDGQAMPPAPYGSLDTGKPSGQEPHHDICSPLCQCACCAVAYTLPLALVRIAPALPSFSNKPGAIYSETALAGRLSLVWQPPRVQ